MGRHKKYTPDKFLEEVGIYFANCASGCKMPTKGGLALHLEMTREMLSDYSQDPEYTNAIKKAYNLIEDEWVQRLKGQSVAGIIFYLKNAFSKDWRDKQEVEVKTLTDELGKD